MRSQFSARPTRVLLGAFALVGVALASSGCASREEAREARIHHMYYPGKDVTPVANSPRGGKDALANMGTFAWDTNLRLLQEDWHRMWFVTQPSELTDWPTIR